ncbi:MAG: hypothetical protein HYV32_05460 [Candidatus Kerfeldbacteria bacterium]|nr:hypothetical protein [Candidatus Kerfeldbacteria bacterium]
MKTIQQYCVSFGHKLREQRLHAHHIGLLFAVYNAFIIFSFCILAIVSLPLVPIGMYILLVSPIFFTGFWLWLTQQIVFYYHPVSIHDALVIAKFSIFPFLLVFIISAVLFEFIFYTPTGFNEWIFLPYYGMLWSVGSIFLGLTVVTFGLRHRIRITSVRK